MNVVDYKNFAPKKLASNFVEEAGIRCFENGEFPDWFRAIEGVLAESGIQLPWEEVKNFFDAVPEEVTDESQEPDELFEIAIMTYLVENDLVISDQVDAKWTPLFSKRTEEVDVDAELEQALEDPAVREQFMSLMDQHMGDRAQL